MEPETLSFPPAPALTEPSAPPPAAPWTPRDVWFGLALLGLWLVLALASALLVAYLRLDVDVGLLITLLEAVLVLPAWWLTMRKYKVGWGALGLRRFSFLMLLLALGLMLVGYAVNMLNALVLLLLDLRADVDLAGLFSQLERPWLFVLGGVVVAPVAEEIFFRSFVFAGLRDRYGWVKAGLISAAVFALIHLQPTMVVPYFALGFLFALLYHQSRSIWPVIAMHAAINGIGLAAAYFLSRMNLVPGG